MSSWMKRHPFAVEAFFERSIVLTYAFPKDRLEKHLPPCLLLDTFENEHAFVAVAMVQTKNLRPKGFPAFLGRDFFLVGYRIFVRYVTQSGKRMRGLYILKSETDRKSMELLGNLFTHYRYCKVDVDVRDTDSRTTVRSNSSDFVVTVEREEQKIPPLPPASPFTDWKEARKFAGPLPYTFSVIPDSQRIVIIEGVRQNWKPRPIPVVEHCVPFVRSLTDQTPTLASAFMTENIPYSWKKGVIDSWTV
jgi:hypothetical protein